MVHLRPIRQTYGGQAKNETACLNFPSDKQEFYLRNHLLVCLPVTLCIDLIPCHKLFILLLSLSFFFPPLVAFLSSLLCLNVLTSVFPDVLGNWPSFPFGTRGIIQSRPLSSDNSNRAQHCEAQYNLASCSIASIAPNCGLVMVGAKIIQYFLCPLQQMLL